MKYYFLIVFVFLSSINAPAQRSMFGSNNNYVKPYQAPAITTAGLVFNFDAAVISSYPGSGNVWNDLVGTNHISFYTNDNYTTAGSPSYSTDGGGSLITTGRWGRSASNSGITGSAARSFEAWVKFNSVSGNSIISIGNKDTNKLFEMMAYQTNLISHPYNSPFTKSSTVLNTSDWYQVVITYDGVNTHRVYINGVLRGTSSGGQNITLNTVNTRIYIGASLLGTGEIWGPFNGKIAAVRVYNTTLSST